MKAATRGKGIAALLLVTFIWGSTFAVTKILDENMSSAAIVAWRFLLAFVALLPFALASEAKRPASENALKQPQLWKDGAIIGLWLIATYGTQTVAIAQTSANRAAFFIALSVVLVPLWLALVERRPLSKLLWAALLLALGGLAIFSWEGGRWASGDFWAIGTAISYAGFIVTMEKKSQLWPAQAFTLAQLGWVAVFGSVWMLLDGGLQLPPSQVWPQLIYLGVVATALTTLLQTVGQRLVSAAEASLIYALEPVAAAVFNFFMLGETIGLRGMVGGAMIVASTVLSGLGGGGHGGGAEEEA